MDTRIFTAAPSRGAFPPHHDIDMRCLGEQVRSPSSPRLPPVPPPCQPMPTYLHNHLPQHLHVAPTGCQRQAHPPHVPNQLLLDLRAEQGGSCHIYKQHIKMYHRGCMQSRQKPIAKTKPLGLKPPISQSQPLTSVALSRELWLRKWREHLHQHQIGGFATAGCNRTIALWQAQRSVPAAG